MQLKLWKPKNFARGVLWATLACATLGGAQRASAQSEYPIDELSVNVIYDMLANIATQSTVDPFGALTGDARAGREYDVYGYYRGQSAPDRRFNGVFDRDFSDGWPSSANQTYYAPSVAPTPTFGKSAWLAPSYEQFVIKGKSSIANDTTGAKLSDFRATRTGGDFGFLWSTLDSRSHFGVLGSYAQGEMTQSLRNNPFAALDDAYESWVHNVRFRTSYTECRFGVNFQREFETGVKAEAIVLGGVQDYNLQRRNETTDGWNALYTLNNGHYSGNLNGNTLSATIRVSKDYELGDRWTFAPTAEVISAHSWIYRGAETGVDLMDAPIPGWGTTACTPFQLTRKVRYSRNTGRVGASLRYSCDVLECDVRALYGSQLGGKDGPTIYGARAGAAHPREYNITNDGYGYGRDTLVLGGGAGCTLFSTGGSVTRARGDYTTVVYRKARKETVSATLTTTF